MKTTNHKGTPGASGRSRPRGRGRRWPAAGALATALLGLALLLPAGVTDDGTGP